MELSPATLQALQEVLDEREQHEARFRELQAEAMKISDFSEDWQLSQFWYSPETATSLANMLLQDICETSKIAIVSAPTIFIRLRELCSEEFWPNIVLFEYDKRFNVYGDQFVFYDYKEPLKIDEKYKGYFDRILLDPPFIEDDCQTKSAITCRFLNQGNARIVVCTGERVSELVCKLHGVEMTDFNPQHVGGLANEFRCYSNYLHRS